jgi:hypothetical protein
MSFLRHAEIYRSDGREKAEEAAASSAHRLDEFPAGYSWAGCSPAEPACASPTSFSVSGPVHQANEFTANGIVSLIRLSQDRGPVHSVPNPVTHKHLPPLLQWTVRAVPFRWNQSLGVHPLCRQSSHTLVSPGANRRPSDRLDRTINISTATAIPTRAEPCHPPRHHPTPGVSPGANRRPSDRLDQTINISTATTIPTRAEPRDPPRPHPAPGVSPGANRRLSDRLDRTINISTTTTIPTRAEPRDPPHRHPAPGVSPGANRRLSDRLDRTINTPTRRKNGDRPARFSFSSIRPNSTAGVNPVASRKE